METKENKVNNCERNGKDHTEKQISGEQNGIGVKVITKYDLRKLLGSGWKEKKHKILDFSGEEFKLITLRGKDGGILNPNLDTSEIERIYLGDNELTDLENVFSLKDSYNFYTLIELDLSGNKLSDQSIENPLNLPFLLKLDLSMNSFTKIPDLSLLENLINLDLSINNISSPSEGGAEELEMWNGIRKCKKLRILDLSFNNLNILPSTLVGLLCTFKNTLVGLNLKGNPFCEIFPEYKSMIVTALPNLKYLDGKKLKLSQKRRNSNFNFGLLQGYDDVFELRLGRRYDVTKMLKVNTEQEFNLDNNKAYRGDNVNHERLDYLIEILECMMEEENSILLCSRFLQGCEKIYNETMKPWTIDGGGDLGDVDVFESRRFIQVFSKECKLPSERERETEKFIELSAIALERQEKDPVSGTDFCRIWLLTALARLMHIPVGGLAISIARLLGNLMERKDAQNEISYIIGTFVLPCLKGRLFSDPIVQTVLACISILPQSRLMAAALRDEIKLILEYTLSHVRTEFHRPLMSVLALASLYKDNAIILSGYGVPVDLAGTLITLYLYSTPSSGKLNSSIGDMGNQGESLAVLGRRETKNITMYEWSSIEHIINDNTSDYIMREIPGSDNLGSGDVFSIYKLAKLLAKRRNKNIKGELKTNKQKETLSLGILPDFVKFNEFQQSLITYYLQIVRNCCLASKKVAASCTELGLHSNFLMPLLSEFLSAGKTFMFDESSSKLCSEIIYTISSLLEASEPALAQMVVNFHLIDWLLIPLKETPFGDPDVVSASTNAILNILNRREYLESMQNAPLTQTFTTVGKSLTIFTGEAPIGSQLSYSADGEAFPVLNYIIQQLDYLIPKLEFLSGNQYFKELISKYCSNLENYHVSNNNRLKDVSSYSTLSSLEMMKNANSSHVHKSIQSILDLLVFVFRNKNSSVCAKILNEIYTRGYCILFMRLLEVPSETIPASAIQILSMIDISEMDLISIHEFLKILKLEAFKRGSGLNDNEGKQDKDSSDSEEDEQTPDKDVINVSTRSRVKKRTGSDFDLSNSRSGENNINDVVNIVVDGDENDSTFDILGHFWMHLLNYIRRMVNNKGSTNWHIFKDTFSEDIGLIVFLGLKYSWNQFIMNSPFRLVVSHLSNVTEFQLDDIYTILSSSRLIRALSRHDGFREHLRRKEIQTLFEYSLKKEEKYFAAFDPDTALEISWCGRSVVWLLGTLRGQNRLSCSKKVATRILSRLADILIGVTDRELYDLEGVQLDKTLMYQRQTSSVAEGLTSLESCFSFIVSRESAIWDLSLEPFVEQLLFLEEKELIDKLEQEELFIEQDGITKTLAFLSSLIDEKLRNKESSNSAYEGGNRDEVSANRTNSTFSAANYWAGVLKGSLLIKEKALIKLSKASKSRIRDQREDTYIKEGTDTENNIESESEDLESNFSDSISSPSDLEKLMILSDSDTEIAEIAEADYQENPNEEIEIIHPKTRNILHGIYHKYGPLTTGSGEELASTEGLSETNIIEGSSEGNLGLRTSTLSTEKCISAQNKLLGTGKVWNNIISGSINNHLPVSAYLRIVYACLKSNTSTSLRKYARKTMSQPYILETTAKLVLSCGLLESHVASKFLLILGNIFETDPKQDALSMDRLIPLYIGFWFVNNILNEVAYILHQSTRRHLLPEEQLLCTTFSRAILAMVDHIGSIQFSRLESIQEYGMEKVLRFFFSPLLVDCLQQMVLFDIQLSIGSSHGTYTAHVPLMFKRRYSPGRIGEISTPETLINLRETMRQCCCKSLSSMMEKSSSLRYRILEGFTYQSVFRHFPLRRSFLFELLEDVNTQHFGRGIELFLSFYYKRNERVIGTYPCYIFIQSKDDIMGRIKPRDREGEAKKKSKGGGLGEMLGINELVDGITGGKGKSPVDELADEYRTPKRCVAVITTRAYYIFERPDTVRNVISNEQYKYKRDPVVIAKREYADLRRIVKSFLGDQIMMLGWDFSSLLKLNKEGSDLIYNKRIQGPIWKNTFYDIIIFDKIEDRDHMLNLLKTRTEGRVIGEERAGGGISPVSINYDFVSRVCLGLILRLENIRAVQFALSEKLGKNELNKPKIDKLYSLKQVENKKKNDFFIIDDILDYVMDYVFPPNKNSRFPSKPYPRAAVLHDIKKAEVRLYVITINSIYELEVDWRYWFCPDSNMLETRDDLYFRKEMEVPPEIDILDIGITNSKNTDISDSGARVGLLNFLGFIDQIPRMDIDVSRISGSQNEIISKFQENGAHVSQNNEINSKSSEKHGRDRGGKHRDGGKTGKNSRDDDNGTRKSKESSNNNENSLKANQGIISLKNFRSEHATWYESKLESARINLFTKIRVFRIHRLRIAQFGPLEEPEVKLVYQLPPKKKSKRSKKESERNKGIKEKSEVKQTLKVTSSDEDPLTDSNSESESDEYNEDGSNENISSKERKYMTRLTSLDLIFMDDSARERFKVGIAIVINELENSSDWKRRMVPVQNHPGSSGKEVEKTRKRGSQRNLLSF
ncbi:leucine-rich repeat [Cryptosporidium bovis]|uniref:leucine-rich repeat n=1 Tax=Cryptosporidium bovis TaxID=310047 RepID=UPI00351A6F5D|nr:leucine-rich repeat [Cryptosporidium bovis]